MCQTLQRTVQRTLQRTLQRTEYSVPHLAEFLPSEGLMKQPLPL